MADSTTKKAENQTSANAEAVELPNAGTPADVKAEENTPKVEAEADKLAQVADISAEINAQIKQGAEAEKKQKKNDEAYGLVFDVEEVTEDEAENGASFTKYFIIGSLLIGGGYMAYMFKNRVKNRIDDLVTQELNQGVSRDIEVDNFGMRVQ